MATILVVDDEEDVRGMAADMLRERGYLVEVADSGPQVPEEHLERIFDRFFRLDESRTDTGEHAGIGLSLVRAFCAAQGLQIHAQNDAAGWVAFQVTLDAPRL